MNKFWGFLLNTLAAFFLLVIAAQLLAPKATENGIINPSKNVPVLGKVLGVSWDATGNLLTKLGESTVDMADQVESSDFSLDEKLQEISQSGNTSEGVNSLIEEVVDKNLENVKNLPNEVVEKIKKQVREEMYSQLCENYLKEKEASNSGE